MHPCRKWQLESNGAGARCCAFPNITLVRIGHLAVPMYRSFRARHHRGRPTAGAWQRSERRSHEPDFEAQLNEPHDCHDETITQQPGFWRLWFGKSQVTSTSVGGSCFLRTRFEAQTAFSSRCAQIIIGYAVRPWGCYPAPPSPATARRRTALRTHHRFALRPNRGINVAFADFTINHSSMRRRTGPDRP